MGIISNKTVKFWKANAKSVQHYIDLAGMYDVYVSIHTTAHDSNAFVDIWI